MGQNLYTILENSAQQYKEHPAVIFKEYTISYGALKEAVDRLANGLKKIHLDKGDRIAVMLPNIPHFPIAYYAILKIGAEVVLFSTTSQPDEIGQKLKETEAKAIVYLEAFREKVREAVQGVASCKNLLVLSPNPQTGEIRLPYLIETCDPLLETYIPESDETAVILYTNGDRDSFKGVELTHDNIWANVKSCSEFFRLTVSDGVVGIIPLFHPFGQSLVMNTFLYAGASLVLHTKFSPEEIVKSIQAHKLTYFVGFPFMYEALVKYLESQSITLPSLHYCLSCGDALRQEVMETFEARFWIPILEGYGLAEGGVVSFNSAQQERRAGSIGLPLPGIEMKIVDEEDREVRSGQVGEIIVQGPNVMKGYFNRAEATKEALRGGWLHTGDLALLDETGFGFIVAQKKNVIVKSGFHIYPMEVENYLMTHPKIAEAVVVGLPDPIQGEEIHACVVLKPGENAEEREIIDYLKECIPLYKCPKTVVFMGSLPKGVTGKVERDQVKKMCIEKSSVRIS